MIQNDLLDKFGAFVVRNLRDEMLDDLEMFLAGKWKATVDQELQSKLKTLSEADRQMIRDLVEHLSTDGMHQLLYALQREIDSNGPIRVLVDGGEVASRTDCLHGELFGDDGWIVRFSKYPSKEQHDLSRWAEEQIRETLARDSENDG